MDDDNNILSDSFFTNSFIDIDNIYIINILLVLYIGFTIYIIYKHLSIYSQLINISGKLIKIDDNYMNDNNDNNDNNNVNNNDNNNVNSNDNNNVNNNDNNNVNNNVNKEDDINQENNNNSINEKFLNYFNKYDIKEFTKLNKSIDNIEYFKYYYVCVILLMILIGLSSFNFKSLNTNIIHYSIMYKVIVSLVLLYSFTVYIRTEFYISNSFKIIKNYSTIVTYDKNNKYILIPNINNSFIFNSNLGLIGLLLIIFVIIYIEISNKTNTL